MSHRTPSAQPRAGQAQTPWPERRVPIRARVQALALGMGLALCSSSVLAQAGAIGQAARELVGQAAVGLGQAARGIGLDGPTVSPRAVLPPADATVDAQSSLTLLQAWRAATVNDAGLRAARAAQAAAAERLPQARAQALPNVAFNASDVRNNVARDGVNALGQPLDLFDRYESVNRTLALRQPLFRLQTLHQINQARFVGEEAAANLDRETQNLATRVTSAYFEALLARDQLALVQAQQRFLRTVVEAETRALAGGSGTRTAVDEAQARLDLNLALELEARQQVEFTRRQLQNFLRQPFGELAQVDPARLAALPLVPSSLEDWVSRAVESSPEVRAVQAQLGSVGQELARVRAGHLPTVDLVAQIQRSRSENIVAPQSSFTNRSVGVQLNVPLYSGGAVNSAVRQASAERERIREQLEGLRLELGLRIHREHRGVTEGLARVRGLEQAARSADVALDSARKSREAGVRSVVDVLNAEQNRMSVLRDLSQARYLTLVSAVRLHALAGVANEDIMALVSDALVR